MLSLFGADSPVNEVAMTGREILHYRIEASLGKGGMGEVFKSTDTRLGRTVALKFLPESVASDSERRARFLVEAQAAARLNSPFAATLYDVAEYEGSVFLVMEYVDGVSLSERLKHGALPLDEALAIAGQVAEALAEAHEQGVIHRDIKPANVMLDRSGCAKVLDFGIAKLFTPAKAAPPTVVTPSLTLPGTVLGTASYMSPEQALGHDVDHRTDIFSLGVVLYEMLCGVRPFRGDTQVRIIDAIVHTPTPPLVGRAARAPERVAAIVRRALAKQVSDRYQTVRSMAADLSAWNVQKPQATEGVGVVHSTQARPGMRHAVAVATFVNVTKRPEDDWLATGIAETVTADLKRVKGLAVVDRERVFSAGVPSQQPTTGDSETECDVDAGRAVAAAWLVAGAFQRTGDRLRITARFTDVETGVVLRTIKIDGPLETIFELEDRIVEELCDGLDLDLARSEISAVKRKETESIEAYRAYSHGIGELRAAEPAAIERAMVLLAEAVEIDPAYSQAWAALGTAYCIKGFFFAQSELVLQALDFEHKALAIDPNNVMAHECLSSAYLALGEVENAVAAAREAIRLDPQRAVARSVHGRAYWLGRGMIEEGIRELEHSTALDPNLGYAYLQLGLLYAMTGDLERAEAVSQRAAELEPHNASGTLGLKMIGARTRLGYVLYRKGRYEEAVAEYLLGRSTIEAGDHALRERALIEIDQKLGAAYLRLGRDAEAATCLERAIASARKRESRHPLDPATSYYVACAHALRGEAALGLEALARAAEGLPAFTSWRAVRDPDLEALAGKPEFKQLLAAAAGHASQARRALTNCAWFDRKES